MKSTNAFRVQDCRGLDTLNLYVVHSFPERCLSDFFFRFLLSFSAFLLLATMEEKNGRNISKTTVLKLRRVKKIYTLIKVILNIIAKNPPPVP